MGYLIFFGIWAAGIIGWVLNVIQIVAAFPATFALITPYMALKLVGIVAVPFGSIMGWIGLFY
jgi:hypothetical protein